MNYRKEIDTLRPPHAVLQSIGDNINSPKQDYGPTIGNVDYVLLFTSKRNDNRERKNDEDIFFSIKVDGRLVTRRRIFNNQYVIQRRFGVPQPRRQTFVLFAL